MGADDTGALGLVAQKLIDFRNSSIVGDHFKIMVVHVENEILTHYGQSNQCNIRCRLHAFFLIKQERHHTRVSPAFQQFFDSRSQPANNAWGVTDQNESGTAEAVPDMNKI